jgi:hypothetical protein
MKTAKIMTILVLALGFVGGAKAQWIVSGNNMYTNISGNVGIRTTNPAAGLHIKANAGNLRLEGTNHVFMEFYPDGPTTRKGWLGYGAATDNNLWLANQISGAHILLSPRNGNVGIGTTSPDAGLHIKANGRNLRLEGTDHVFMEFYPDGSTTRKGWLGYGAATDNNLVLRNEISGAHIILNPRSGNVGIGTDSPKAELDVEGRIRISNSSGQAIMELGEGLDYAEGFDVSDKTEMGPGSVLIIDADNPGKLALSCKPYDSKVAGIVAGAKGNGSGVRLGSEQFDFDVALAGRVYCNVDATEVGIEPGDLLTTSDKPGYAMKAVDHARAQGAILGKAMEKLEKPNKGQILVLVTLQ